MKFYLTILLFCGAINASLADGVASIQSIPVAINQTKNKQLSEISLFIKQAEERAAQYFDFKMGKFIPNITPEQKQIVFDAISDSLIQTEQQMYRFNRYEQQPKLSEEERKKLELEIEAIVDRCVAYIGEEPQDSLNKMLTLKQGDYYQAIGLHLPGTVDSAEIIKHIQPSYLQGRVDKCVSFLYGVPYSLGNFEYYDYAAPKSALFRKRQMLEPLYEDLYNKIKEAGLLRAIPSAYYPKSLIRLHAKYLKLTETINKQQKKNKSKLLNHEQLAVEFFGSYKAWFNSLTSFININSSNKRDYFFKYNYEVGDFLIKEYCPASGQMGLNVVYKINNGILMRAPEVFLEYLSSLQCVRIITSNEVLNFRDKIYVRASQYFEFKDEKSSFYKKITEQQAQQFFEDHYDLQIETLSQLYRFDREEKQPFEPLQEGKVRDEFLKKQKLQKEKIQNLLNQCSQLVGFNLYTERPKYDVIWGHSTTRWAYEAAWYAQNEYQLDGSVAQCIHFLYGENYSLSDFDYPAQKQLQDRDYLIKQEAELLYEEAYLRMKNAGYLRRTPSAFYPKSFVRAYADESGLTNFIYQEEKQAKQQLDHEQLAIKYFGSRDKWVKSFSGFINKKMSFLKL